MTFTDRLLQRWRIAKIKPFLKSGDRVLDIGSADGVLFQKLPWLARESLGIDPTLTGNVTVAGVRLVRGFFPADLPAAVAPFDAITMLAVLEHFPEAAYQDLVTGCARTLRPGGRLLITVPSPFVDKILAVLTFLRLVHGMSLEEHHGYEVGHTTRLFAPPGFQLICQRRFQLGLNNLFVFERTAQVTNS